MPTLTRSISVFILSFFGLSSYCQSVDTTILFQSLVIQFDTDQSSVKESYQNQLDMILAAVDTLDGVHVVVEAHTDDVGDADYNLKLSGRRAEAIQDYLVNAGFEKEAVSIESLGERQLLLKSVTEESRALNRRAVLSVYYLNKIVDPTPAFEGVLIKGVAAARSSGDGVASKIVISGKQFKKETIADSLGYFEAEVPENAILKFQAFPLSTKFQPNKVMAKSTPNQIQEGVLIELDSQAKLASNNLRTLSGIVADEYDQPLANAMLKFQGKTVNDSLLTDGEGRFEIEIPERETVRLSTYFKGYFYDQKLISPISDKHTSEVKLVLPKLEEGRRYVADDILFVGDRDVVLPTSMINLKSLKEVVRLAEGYCFKIEGHINLPWEGKVARTSSNFKLSVDRAIRIYKFLLDNGIADDRICYEGFGNWNMLYPKANTSRQQMLNRRVEVLVIPCGN